jgi:hypothetical protein
VSAAAEERTVNTSLTYHHTQNGPWGWLLYLLVVVFFAVGWGIHWNPWGGWVWNIWGFDCVVLQLNRGMFRVGTDDPDGLVEFLRRRIVPVR